MTPNWPRQNNTMKCCTIFWWFLGMWKVLFLKYRTKVSTIIVKKANFLEERGELVFDYYDCYNVVHLFEKPSNVDWRTGSGLSSKRTTENIAAVQYVIDENLKTSISAVTHWPNKLIYPISLILKRHTVMHKIQCLHELFSLDSGGWNFVYSSKII